ncbi:MAG: zinc ABC transporter substrate-binding protein [Planctomycetes bacterium]|nr:zinc ABC transporter substrate-binding protein [Planctomycetota bacterium]
MRRHVSIARLVLFALFLPFAGCGDNGVVGKTGNKKEIYVSFPPLAQFARRIVGDTVAVHCPVPMGVDPAAWKPSRDEIALFQTAPLVLVHGAELENWVDKASLPASRVVDVSAGLENEFAQVVHPGHAHGAGGEGSHSHVDSHVWMDPTLAKRQAFAILEAVGARWPDLQPAARGRYAGLAAEFDTLDKRWKALAPKLAAAKHYNASHNFAYLAKRYGFTFADELHLAPRAVPDAAVIEQLGKDVAAGPKYLWWETEPSDDVKKALTDALDFRHIVLDSGESAGIEGSDVDYFEVQGKNLDVVDAALKN